MRIPNVFEQWITDLALQSSVKYVEAKKKRDTIKPRSERAWYDKVMMWEEARIIRFASILEEHLTLGSPK